MPPRSGRAISRRCIADIEDRLSRAMVIDPTTLSGDKVVFGATVTLLDEEDKKVRYQLVGQTEADARVGRISYNSPLGRALIGRQKGDEVECLDPGGRPLLRDRQDRVHLMLPLRSATAIIAMLRWRCRRSRSWAASIISARSPALSRPGFPAC